MSKSKVSLIIVVGEGEKSEAYYVHWLNIYMREKDIRLKFEYVPARGGDFSSLHRTASKQSQANRQKYPVVIWADYDRYDRDDAGDARKLLNAKARGSQERIYFNYQNFEDFLSLHFPTPVVQGWQTCCRLKGHFRQGGAMCEETYLPLFLQHVCAEYHKGSFDYESLVDDESLKRLFAHNKDDAILFRSDFATLMEIEMGKRGYKG